MALSNNVVWEVRSDTGVNTNGGGFDPTVSSPGTDYTYPTSGPISYTDIVIGSTTTTATSVARPFISADVGNTINIISGSGFTTGRYTVVSVASGVATFDRSLGSAASTGGHGTLGGAFASPYGLSSANVFTGQHIAWIRATGTYAVSNASSFSASNGAVYGYGSTRYDGSYAVFTQAAQVDIFDGNGVEFAFLNITNNQAYTSGIGAQNGFVHDCFFNCTGQASIGTSQTPCTIKNCYFTGAGGAINIGGYGNQTVVENCYFYAAQSALSFGSSNTYNLKLLGNVFYNCGGTFRCNGLCEFSGNSVISHSSTPIDIEEDSGQSIGQVGNNIFSNITGYGIKTSNTALDPLIKSQFNFNGNAFYNCSSGNKQNLSALSSDVTLTADPFVNSSGGDYRLNNTAGGGAAIRGKGLPINFPNLGSVTNNRDMGAYQHTDPSGVGVISTSMDGGMS